MPNTHTTPASVASRLTDEWIETTASNFDNEGYCYIAAVLRDYVRLRKLVKAVKNAADSVNECHSDSDYFSAMNEIKDILADAEKGDAK